MVSATLKRWGTQIKGGAIHPLILPVFPVLSLYLNNLGQGFLSQAAPILVGVFTLSLASWVLIYALMKDRNKSALIVSTFFVLFFSFGHGLTVIRVVLEQLNLLDKLWFILYAQHARPFWTVIWVIFFIAITVLIVKRKRDLKKLTDVLNLMAVTLAVIAAGNFLLADGFRLYLQSATRLVTATIHGKVSESRTDHQPEIKYHAFLPFISKPEPSDPKNSMQFEQIWLRDFPATTTLPQQLPDIYYIIPDMYIRADYLTELYQCDTSDFLSALEERGFFIASESRSNYHLTAYSLASSLNYMYLNDPAEQVGDMSGHTLSAQMIQQNRIAVFLKSQGYTTIAFATGFWFTELEDANIFMEPPTTLQWLPGEFEAGAIKLTPLSAFSIFNQSRDEVYRQRTLYTLAHIPDATKIDAPTFTFAHILSPHDPFVFDAYGAPIPSRDSYSYEEHAKAYCNNVLHINRRLQEVVDKILSHSVKPAIIIIQSDHGACYGDYAEHINERMSNLNAYYFYDQRYDDLYPGITPVNTFRVVLNNYFGADYALLADISYYLPPNSNYGFVDVTDKVIGK